MRIKSILLLLFLLYSFSTYAQNMAEYTSGCEGKIENPQTFNLQVEIENREEEPLKYLGEERPGMTPVKFAPDLVSLPDQSEFGSIFSGDGKEFYYAVDIDGKAEIRFMRLHKGQWTKPMTLISDKVFSYNDPMLSPDESKLYFISDQSFDNSEKKKDYDIWYAERTEDGWSMPVNAGSAINSDKHEYYVAFSESGTMYFSSNRKISEEARENFNIFSSIIAYGVYQSPIPLDDSINTKDYEADVFVASDESYLIFCGDRADGFGRGDLYISFKKTDGSWTKAKNMGRTINTAGHELCPFVTKDGKYFFYTSNEDIYWVDARVIHDLK